MEERAKTITSALCWHPVDSVMALVTGISKDRRALTRTSPSSLGGLMLDRWMVLHSPEFSFTTMASAFMTCMTCIEEGKRKLMQRKRKEGQATNENSGIIYLPQVWHCHFQEPMMFDTIDVQPPLLTSYLNFWYVVVHIWCFYPFWSTTVMVNYLRGKKKNDWEHCDFGTTRWWAVMVTQDFEHTSFHRHCNSCNMTSHSVC